VKKKVKVVRSFGGVSGRRFRSFSGGGARAGSTDVERPAPAHRLRKFCTEDVDVETVGADTRFHV